MAKAKPNAATKPEQAELTEQTPEAIVEPSSGDESTTNTDPVTHPAVSTTTDMQTPNTDAPTSREQTSEQQQAEHTLIEAFPSIEAKVVRAVLVASGGQLEQAFNALLGMSDPDFKPPNTAQQPPAVPQTPAAQRQMEQDEMYARQLAQHYQASQIRPQRQPPHERDDRNPPLPSRPQQSDRDRLYPEDRERSFFDDDLPEITEGVKKTFLETQTKFTNWMAKLQKKLDGDDQDPYNGAPVLDRPSASQHGPRTDSHAYGRRDKSRDRLRKSGDSDGFDADPRVIGDDFANLELRDDYSAGPESQPRLPGRPTANPNLFKPTPPTPPQSAPVDEVDAAERRPQNHSAPLSGGKSAKWQPLTSLEPRPEAEENDPFSVGDEGEDDAADVEDKSKDQREADSARLNEAASKSDTAEQKEKPTVLVEHDKGSVDNKDKIAEALLTSHTGPTDNTDVS